MDLLDTKLKPKWGGVPSKYYTVWLKELYVFHVWPQERSKLFTVAIACMERLLKITDIEELSFGYGSKQENTMFSFELNKNKAKVNKEDVLDGEWVEMYRELWGKVSVALNDGVEVALAVITKVLFNSIPLAMKNQKTIELPGITVSWYTENLTGHEFLDKILQLNKNNPIEE